MDRIHEFNRRYPSFDSVVAAHPAINVRDEISRGEPVSYVGVPLVGTYDSLDKVYFDWIKYKLNHHIGLHEGTAHIAYGVAADNYPGRESDPYFATALYKLATIPEEWTELAAHQHVRWYGIMGMRAVPDHPAGAYWDGRPLWKEWRERFRGTYVQCSDYVYRSQHLVADPPIHLSRAQRVWRWVKSFRVFR